MTRYLEIPLKNGDYAVIKPCARASAEILEFLLKKLHQEWKDTNSLTSKTCQRTLNKILVHLPREDDYCELTIDMIREVDLGHIFLARIDDQGNVQPCDLIALHQYEPCKSSKEIPALEDEMTVDNIPIPSSGDITADLLSVLLTLTNGDAVAAQTLLDLYDAETLDKILFGYNERQRDPEDRLREYKAKEFKRIKEEKALELRKLQFGF